MRVSRTRIAIAIVAASVVAVAGGLALAGHHEKKDLPNTSKMWEKHYNAGNAAGVAALYTEDGVAMPPNAPAAKGRAAIEAHLAKEMESGSGTLSIKAMEHDHSGNLGYSTGTYEFRDDAGKVVDAGKWVEVQKKIDGKWYIHRDIWNSDMAPAG